MNDNWIQRPQPNPSASLRLFCVPYAGASARIFYPWSAQLPETVDLCAVELPGRGRRATETPHTRLMSLVEAIAPAILPWLDRPFVLFGHSMGALIAFELVRYLRELDKPQPDRLLVSGRRAPQFPDDDPPSYNLSDEELLEKLRWLKGTPPEVLENPEMQQLLLPLLRADFEVCETYEYVEKAPLACPLVAMGGWRDPAIRGGGLRGWRYHTTGKFEKKVFPGNHFFLNSARDRWLRFLSKQLVACERV